MKPDIVIRQLTMDDFENYFSLRLEALQQHPTAYMSSYDQVKSSNGSEYQRILKDTSGNSVILGASIDGVLIGIIGLAKETKSHARHKSHIWGMYVNADHRKHGIGKLLIESAIKYAKDIMQCHTINISVETENIGAKKLYEKYGFKIWGTEPDAVCVDGKYYSVYHLSLIR